MDNDPTVLAHARALMKSHPAGATSFIQADLREPGKILASPALHATLDLGRPVALMLIAVLHFLGDADDPHGIVAQLLDALPSGSFLTISHLTGDFDPEEADAAQAAAKGSGVTYHLRSRAEVAAFFAGLDLLYPAWNRCWPGGRTTACRRTRKPCAFTPRWAASRSRTTRRAFQRVTSARPGSRGTLRPGLRVQRTRTNVG